MPVDVLRTALFSVLLLAASVWDLRVRIIPNTLCLLIFCVGLLGFDPARLPGILLGLPFLLGALLAQKCGTGGIGGGDIKLTAACGFVLGLPRGVTGLILTLPILCAGYLIFSIHAKCKKQSRPAASQTAMPLAPFLSVGFLAASLL